MEILNVTQNKTWVGKNSVGHTEDQRKQDNTE